MFNFLKISQKDISTTGCIIRWWERRRKYYNLVVGLAGILGLTLIKICIPKISLFFGIPFVILYGILANLLYTTGWISFIILKKVFDTIWDFEKYMVMLYIIGTILSLMITLCLCMFIIIESIP